MQSLKPAAEIPVEKQLAYLYTIARNLCIDHFRKCDREELVFDEESWNELPDERDEAELLPEQIAVRQVGK